MVQIVSNTTNWSSSDVQSIIERLDDDNTIVYATIKRNGRQRVMVKTDVKRCAAIVVHLPTKPTAGDIERLAGTSGLSYVDHCSLINAIWSYLGRFGKPPGCDLPLRFNTRKSNQDKLLNARARLERLGARRQWTLRDYERRIKELERAEAAARAVVERLERKVNK